MIDLNYINGFYPPQISNNAALQKHILKEYIQLMVLDYLSTSSYINKLAFIGGTNLRLIKGIDRFSEDLDFDCKELSEGEFIEMTNSVITFLQNSGLNVVARDKANAKLTAFRRNIYFPEFLFDLGLSGHKEERFLLKIEAQDQGTNYTTEMKYVQKCGFFFSLPTPPDSVLLAMKFSALLARAKGRDFYDTMFLMQQTKPSYSFLRERMGIATAEQLKNALNAKLNTTDLNVKKRDFEHLLFNVNSAEKILLFPTMIEQL
ncbi:MAG: nucleotidyl transferase AbiEii/AbiGii toxin family protein [Bacteroidaceae bacterium]